MLIDTKKLPNETQMIFDSLRNGNFIVDNHPDTRQRRLFAICENYFDTLTAYFQPLGYDLERGDGSYIGAYCDASAGFGIGYSASGSLGLTVGASNSYQGLKPLFKSNSGISVSKSKFGFTFGASAGVRGGFY